MLSATTNFKKLSYRHSRQRIQFCPTTTPSNHNTNAINLLDIRSFDIASLKHQYVGALLGPHSRWPSARQRISKGTWLSRNICLRATFEGNFCPSNPSPLSTFALETISFLPWLTFIAFRIWYLPRMVDWLVSWQRILIAPSSRCGCEKIHHCYLIDMSRVLHNSNNHHLDQEIQQSNGANR